MANGDVLYKKDVAVVTNNQFLHNIASQLGIIRYKENKPEATEEYLDISVMSAYAADPRLVELNESGDPDTVRYPNLIPILLGALKHQQALIEDLQTRVTALGG